MTKKLFLTTCLFLLAFSSASRSFAQPMGYERWTSAETNSAAFFDLRAKDLLNSYADPMVIGLPTPPKKNTRVIDIEYDLDSETGEHLISGIWIDNTSGLKQESWFIPQLKWEDVKLLEQLGDDVMIVDIERFERAGQLFFGAIVERNRVKRDWMFEIDLTLDDINDYRSKGYRVIDIDYVWMDIGTQGGFKPRFDVVLAENAVENYMLDGIELRDQADVWNIGALGNQIIDIEYIPQMDQYVCSYVEVWNLWDFMWNQNSADVNFLDYGRVADLEGSHTGPKQWYKIHLLDD